MTSLVKDNNLQDLIENDDSIFNIAAIEAVSQVETALFQRYDTLVELAKVGSARNMHLVKLMKHIVIYEIFKRLPHLVMPLWAMEDNLVAVDTLKKLASGDFALNIPRKVVDDKNVTRRKFLSQFPRTH